MQDSVIYGPLELPSGKKIMFRPPLGSDRANVLAMTKISADRAVSDAMLVDDYVAAKCVTQMDGNKAGGDYKHLMDSWTQQDILFFRAVFDEMFGMNKEAVGRAKEAAGFLLKGRTFTAGSSLPDAAK